MDNLSKELTLKELGEFRFIRRFASVFNHNLPSGVEGIGNDCAVIPHLGSHSLLVTTDLLIENTHFIKTKIAPEDLGYKALAVNLSDIAAMGGQPLYAFLSLGLPPDTPLDWTDRFFAGFRELAQQMQVNLLGGDTTRSELIVINVLVMGSIETAHIKRRSQARLGDLICCTGHLGDSGAGLKVILEDLPLDSQTAPFIQAHVRPRAHVEEGRWLAQHANVHAMMDVSDGIDADIRHVMEESHCGAHIEIEHLPLSPALRQAAQRWRWSAEELALSAGEDYCLLLTVDPQEYEKLNEAYQEHFQRPLFRIGTIENGSELNYTYHQQPFKLIQSGFDHFKFN